MKLHLRAAGLVMIGGAFLLSACSNSGGQTGAPPAAGHQSGKPEGDRVRVRFTATPDGNVINPEVISSTNPAANEAALDGIRKLKIPAQPLTRHHLPNITMTTTIVVTKGHVQPAKTGPLQSSR